MVKPHPSAYLDSLCAELQSQANRVRDLIGDAHWLHEGRHKEHLLLQVVKRHLPSVAIASTGFVLSPTQPTCSREQDILVVNCGVEAPLFNEGGLILTFPRTALACISVKTSFDSSTLQDAASSLMSARLAAAESGVDPRSIWCGAYFFRDSDRVDDELPLRWYKDYVASTSCRMTFAGSRLVVPPVDLIASATKHAFIADVYGSAESGHIHLRGFQTGESLSTAVFLAHLIDHVAVRLGSPRGEYIDFADLPAIKQFCDTLIDV